MGFFTNQYWTSISKKKNNKLNAKTSGSIKGSIRKNPNLQL
jgi:hypothetical protein